MRIVGVDPGSAATGYGVVEEREHDLHAVRYGAITPSARLPFAQRLLQIYRDLRTLLEECRPDCAAVEAVFFARNVQTALRLGQARGVVLMTLAEAGIAVHEYSALEVKQAVTGYGQAQKSQVQVMVATLLHLPESPQPADAADALALAICHRQAARLAGRLRKS